MSKLRKLSAKKRFQISIEKLATRLDPIFRLTWELFLLFAYSAFAYIEYFYKTIFPPRPKSLKDDIILV